MASISKERLREMEEEMDRFEAEIEAPGQPPGSGFILGANTFNRVQARLTTLRREADEMVHSSKQKQQDVDQDNIFGDEDLRIERSHQGAPSSRLDQNFEDEGNEFFDVDERPGRAHGPRLAPPPPPPPPPPGVGTTQSADDARNSKILAPPPPPPPPPDGMDGGGGVPIHPQPAFMPPQLRHRMPVRPPPGQRPPFPRPPGMRMGGPPPPPPPSGVPFGRPPGPHFMGGPPMGPGPNMMPIGPMRPMGPMGHPMGMPGGPPMGAQPGPQDMRGMIPGMADTDKQGDQPKVYSAAPVINVELKKDETKKKKKKKKAKEEEESNTSSTTSTTPATPSSLAPTSLTEGNPMVGDMDMPPANAMYGGMIGVGHGAPSTTSIPGGMPGQPMGMMQGMMGGMDASGVIMAPGADPTSNAAGVGGKKEKKKKEKKFIRMAANTTWEDPTLSDWTQDDFRIFAGDLGNEVTDDTLVRAFSKYPGFLKAKVIRDRRSNKTKGYGFISFKDPVDFAKAMREMNGKYVGNRPIKLRKSNWKDRNIEVVKKKDKEKKRLGLK